MPRPQNSPEISPEMAGLTKQGTGTFTLSGTNTYNGDTTVNDGTLQADSVTAFGNGSNVEIANVATLDLNGFDNTVGAGDSD